MGYIKEIDPKEMPEKPEGALAAMTPENVMKAIAGMSETDRLEAQLAIAKKRAELEKQLMELGGGLDGLVKPGTPVAAMQNVPVPPVKPAQVPTDDPFADVREAEEAAQAEKKPKKKLGLKSLFGFGGKAVQDIRDFVPGAETPPGGLTGAPADAFEAAAASPAAPGLLGDDIVGETESFEDYNMFQKREVTASDLESLIMLERAIMKGEQRKPGESNPMKWVTVLIGGGIGLVIVLFLAKDLGLFAF